MANVLFHISFDVCITITISLNLQQNSFSVYMNGVQDNVGSRFLGIQNAVTLFLITQLPFISIFLYMNLKGLLMEFMRI